VNIVSTQTTHYDYLLSAIHAVLMTTSVQPSKKKSRNRVWQIWSGLKPVGGKVELQAGDTVMDSYFHGRRQTPTACLIKLGSDFWQCHGCTGGQQLATSAPHTMLRRSRYWAWDGAATVCKNDRDTDRPTLDQCIILTAFDTANVV